MRIKYLPEDFVVEERLALPLTPTGPWGLYRVHKTSLSTLELQTRLAAAFGVGRGQVILPALKDRQASTTQFASLPAYLPPQFEGQGYRAERLGFSTRPLAPTDLRGNRFALVIRDLSASEAVALSARLRNVHDWGLPNYFDEQRFGSYSPGWGYIGKAILQRDAEAALRAYLARPFAGDPPPVARFKRAAATLGSDWSAMLAKAPRPSNYGSVLTYLVGHPHEYRKALNLIPQRLLSLYLAAYQSSLWNRLLATYLEGLYARHGITRIYQQIADQTLPFHGSLNANLLAELSTLAVPLPEHHAHYTGAWQQAVDVVLSAEGLALADLKARILARAYLSRGRRAALLLPEELVVEPDAEDERFPGKRRLRVRFSLPPGSYATLVLKGWNEGPAQ